MKKYFINPNMAIHVFAEEDIITGSSLANEAVAELKKTDGILTLDGKREIKNILAFNLE